MYAYKSYYPSSQQFDHGDLVNLLFRITYPEGYPDLLPEINLDIEEGDLEEDELSALITELKVKVRNPRG